MIILLKKLLRRILNELMDYIGWMQKFSFPKKYIWQWKRDFLFWRYEKETTDLFKKIVRPGMAVVDIGAHIGYYTRLFSKLVGKNGAVYAFEADPENFEWLEKNTKHLVNVKKYQIAISDRPGIVDFYHCEEKCGHHTTVSNAPVDFPMRKISVQSTDLDSFFAEKKIASVDLIKMDIDGGEPAVFRGMQKTLEKNHSIQIISEFAPAWISAGGVDPDMFLKKITSLGFYIFAITPDGPQDFYTHPASNSKNRSPRYVINLYFKRPILKG